MNQTFNDDNIMEVEYRLIKYSAQFINKLNTHY